jgi:hypothetical protein
VKSSLAEFFNRQERIYDVASRDGQLIPQALVDDFDGVIVLVQAERPTGR